MILDLETRSIDMFLGERHELGSWVLLASDLPNRRPNAAHPLGVVDDVAAAVDAAIAWYGERSRRPLFKVSPLAPPELCQELERRGFVGEHGADVYVLSGLDGFVPIDGVDLRQNASWFNIVGIDDAARFIAAHRGDDLAWATVPGVAAGLGVLQDNTVGVFNMATRVSERRSGHGSVILRSILGWASERGATNAYLQVVRSNEGAVALYKGLGFEFAYEYLYWTKSPH